MTQLVRKLKRYSVSNLPHTCTMFEIGNFSDLHAHCGAAYQDSTFIPPSPCGLYCATFVKDDQSSDAVYEIINESFKRIYQTLWKPSKDGQHKLRFCLFKEKV